MEILIVILLVVLIILTLFNVVSIFIFGSALMRNSELLEDIIVTLQRRITRGRRYTPDENLMDVANTQFPFENP